MSLRLRLLLIVAAVNVGVLLLVVGGVGLRKPEIGAAAFAEALRVATAEDDRLEDTRPWRYVRGVSRLLGEGTIVELAWPPGEEAEIEEGELRRLVARGEPVVRHDANGLLFVSEDPDAYVKGFYVAYSDEARWAAREPQRRLFLFLGGGTLLLVLTTYLLLSRMLRPLEDLMAAAREVAKGRSPPRVEPRGDREMVRLVEGFNRMAAEVHEYQQHLEERVMGALGRAKAAEGRLVVAQRLAATGSLAAGFAHEINNPLGGTLNALRKLQDGDLSEDRREEYFALALDGLERIKTIVERILNFTPRQREPTEIDVADACRRVEGLARHRAERVGCVLELELEPVPPVVGDPQELTQAVLNLVLNAVDATAAAQRDRRAVTLRTRTSHGDVCIQVADNGVGMDEETARRCVDLFYTTKPEGEGTGLGMAIVQHIVTDHGGSLDIDSTPGEGTTIEIRLPPA